MSASKSVCALVALGSACSGTAQVPASQTGSNDGGSEAIPGGPVPGACKLGEPAADVDTVTMATLIANPGTYLGKVIRIRGYFVLQVENVAVFEPVQRKARVLVDVSRLPARSEQELLQCRLKLVDIEGEIGTVHSRSGEHLHIRARAMAGVDSKSLESDGPPGSVQRPR